MTSATPVATTASATPAINPGISLVMALIAGSIGWAVIQVIHPAFLVPQEYHIAGMGAPPERVDALVKATTRTDRKNITLYSGLLGALLAAGLAASGRSIKAVAIAAPVGLLLGGLAGCVASLAYGRLIPNEVQTDMTSVVAVQAILLGGVGLAAGIGIAAARGRALEIALSAIGGLIAGGLAGAIYPVLMSVTAPTINTTPLLPLEAASRLIWILLAAGLIGLFIPLAARGRAAAAPQPSGS